MSRGRWMAAGLALALGVVGCSRTPEQPRPDGGRPGPQIHEVRKPGTESLPTVTNTGEPGIVTGTVRWAGPIDPLAQPAVNPEFTVRVGGQQQMARLWPRIRVDSGTGGVADVVVWLEKAPAGSKPALPQPVKLTQKVGDLQPRVLAVPVGTILELATTDEQTNLQAAGAANFSLATAQGKIAASPPLTRPGHVELRSQGQPWLTGHVWVFDHPFFAVSDSEGRFRLPALPPGDYPLKLWHAGWHEPARPVERVVSVPVTAQNGAAVELVLSAADAN